MEPHAATEAATGALFRRDNDDGYGPFWFTTTGIIVKWIMFLAIVLGILLYLIVSYLHARKRLQRGLPPLAYHRWLVRRTALAHMDPYYAYPSERAYAAPVYYPPPGEGYSMHPVPPPVYDPNAPRPPKYENPKADPVQPQTELSGMPAPHPGPAPEYFGPAAR